MADRDEQAQGSPLARAWTGVGMALVMAWPGAQAQFSRLEQEIELKALDRQPNPAFLREPGLQVYGLVDLGIVRTVDEPARGCKPAQQAHWGLDTLSRNRIGVRAVETLDSGLRAHLQIEQSLSTDTGLGPDDCVPGGVDATRLIGLSHRRYGRLDLGLREQPAYQVVLLGDPWAGAGRAARDDRLYPRAPPGVAPQYGPRSDHSITVVTREFDGWWLEAQGTLTGEDDAGGLALRYRGGGFVGGIAGQRWAVDTGLITASGQYTFGAVQGFAGITGGQAQGLGYRHVIAGVAYTVQHYPWVIWRAGLSYMNWQDQDPAVALGLGWEYPLSRRTAIHGELGLPLTGPSPRQAGFGFGLRHGFTL